MACFTNDGPKGLQLESQTGRFVNRSIRGGQNTRFRTADHSMKLGMLLLGGVALWTASVVGQTNQNAAVSGGMAKTTREVVEAHSFTGIGVVLGFTAEGPVAMKVLWNTPASESGLKAGDLIIEIDSETTKGLGKVEVQRKLRGPVGSPVELLLKREAVAHPLKVKLVRRTIASSPEQSRSYAFTCQKCGSTMMCPQANPSEATETRVIYESPSFAACDHSWKSGISVAYPQPISNGTVILVRKDKAFGAFIPTEQTTNPSPKGKVAYQWWYRTDGDGNLDPTDSNVHQGTGFGRSAENMRNPGGVCVGFGPFEIGWSAHSDGHGWIYFDGPPGEPIPSDGVRICVTTLKTVDGINAADSQWRFKRSRVE